MMALLQCLLLNFVTFSVFQQGQANGNISIYSDNGGQNYAEGDAMILTCNFTTNVASYTVTFESNGQDLCSSNASVLNHRVICHGKKLIFLPVKVEDSGCIKCKVSHDIGESPMKKYVVRKNGTVDNNTKPAGECDKGENYTSTGSESMSSPPASTSSVGNHTTAENTTDSGNETVSTITTEENATVPTIISGTVDTNRSVNSTSATTGNGALTQEWSIPITVIGLIIPKMSDLMFTVSAGSFSAG